MQRTPGFHYGHASYVSFFAMFGDGFCSSTRFAAACHA